MGTGKANRTPPRATARGQATKARIIQAAAALVAARGVAGTTLDDVMEASSTSRSQIYHYFADKDALMCAVVKAQSDRVLGFHASSLAGIDSLEDLRRWRNQVVKLNRATRGVGGCPIGSLASELADRSEEARELLAKSFQRWESYLAMGLKAMQDRGVLGRHAHPDDLATAVVSALQGGLLLTQTTRSTRPLELALDMALDHVSAHSVRRRALPAGHPTRAGGGSASVT
jgi:TetR/AcrR family transcriptional regulator, transcriptional repressor for nem operon